MYVAVEWMRVGVSESLGEQYAQRFMALFARYKETQIDNAEFCHWFGLGMHLFWYFFPGATEEMGGKLMKRAGRLDSFWARFLTQADRVSQDELAARLRGRGILAAYYAVNNDLFS